MSDRGQGLRLRIGSTGGDAVEVSITCARAGSTRAEEWDMQAQVQTHGTRPAG